MAKTTTLAAMRVPTAPTIILSRRGSVRCGDMRALKGRCVFRADMMAQWGSFCPWHTRWHRTSTFFTCKIVTCFRRYFSPWERKKLICIYYHVHTMEPAPQSLWHNDLGLLSIDIHEVLWHYWRSPRVQWLGGPRIQRNSHKCLMPCWTKKM